MVLRTPLSVCLKLKARFEHEWHGFGLLIPKKSSNAAVLRWHLPLWLCIVQGFLLYISKVNLYTQSLKCSSLNFEFWPSAIVQIHATLAHTMQITSVFRTNKQANKQTNTQTNTECVWKVVTSPQQRPLDMVKINTLVTYNS